MEQVNRSPYLKRLTSLRVSSRFKRFGVGLAMASTALATSVPSTRAEAHSAQLRPILLGHGYSPLTITCSTSRCLVTGEILNGSPFAGVLNPVSGEFRVLHVAKLSDNDILAVTCPTNGTCLAVGHSATGFAETISASTGAFGPVTTVPGTFGLDAVACASPSSCWAAGYVGTYPKFTSVFVPLAALGAPEPVLTGQPGEALDVACPTSSTCLGAESNTATASRVVTLRHDRITASDPTGRLLHLSCGSPTECFGVGLSDLVPVNGSSGVARPAITLPRYKQLQAVACPSATECVIAGYTSIETSTSPLSKNTNAFTVISEGRPGVTQPLAMPAGAGPAAFACSAVTLCWAIGTGTSGGVIVPVPVTP